MRHPHRIVALVLTVAVACALIPPVLKHMERDRVMRQQIGIWQAKYAAAASTVEHRLDTVRVVLTRYKTLRDSFVVTDTVGMPAEWPRFLAMADTMYAQCHALANDCDTFHRVADSTLTVQRAATDWYKQEASYYQRHARAWKIATGVLGGFIVWRTFR